MPLEKPVPTIRHLMNNVVAWTNNVAEIWGTTSGNAVSTARRPIRVGTIIIAVTFLGFGLWAAIAPIGSAAIAPGVISVESGRQTIQHFEGGIVKRILVTEGSRVKAGDVLIELDGTRSQAELGLVLGQLYLAEATRARLVAERDGLAEPDFPLELKQHAEDPEVADLMTGQKNLFNARLAVIKGQESILQQQIAQYQKQIEGYRSIEESKLSQLKLVKTELNDLSSLLDQGYVTKSRVLALQRDAAQLDGDRGQALAEISRAEQGIGEANRQILQLERQHQEDVSKDLRQVEGQLDDLQQRRIAAADVVSRLEIRAPIDGTVANLNIHTVGGVISPSTILMEIVPDKDKLVVEAELNPRDIDTVKVGDQVALRIATADSRLTPVIYGMLDEISDDRVMTQQGRGAYRVKISIPPEQAARLGDQKLHVGMPVEALITRGSTTALHYALKPLLDSLSRSFRER
ncbi:MAG TPA: HlyD family type I secretion periplasmic adaptor subunit [Alphaproteobacteria bacterium]|nr:HlyD family type I secretion periplasmic adaptor subunit [Alphaproteobacteria bacterium]